MKFVAEVRLDPADEDQGGTVAAYLEGMANEVRHRRTLLAFSRRVEVDSIWKVVP